VCAEVNRSQTAVMDAVMDEPPASSSPPRPHSSSRDEEDCRQEGHNTGDDSHTPTQAARDPVGCSLDANDTGEADAEAMEAEQQGTTIDAARRAEESNGVQQPMDSSTAEDPPSQATVVTTPTRTPIKVRTPAGVFRTATRHVQPAALNMSVCKRSPRRERVSGGERAPLSVSGCDAHKTLSGTLAYLTSSHTQVRNERASVEAQARCIVAVYVLAT
jgi:hypothetical protein